MTIRILILLVVFGFVGSVAGAADSKMKACVYFDRSPERPEYRLGELYAIMTRNLLGHFREVESTSRALVDYSAGELNSCDRVIYLGSFYNAPMKDAFIDDILAYKKPVLWVNYNIWNLQKRLGIDEFKKRFGFTGVGLESYKNPPTRENPLPPFYKLIHYKGEVFEKLQIFDKFQQKTLGYAEIYLTKPEATTTVLATAEHTGTHEKTPYILRKDDFFYVADNPLSFIHESDRYLVYADILFDFLKLEPRLKKKYALVRIEDIHGAYNPLLIYRAVDSFRLKKNTNGQEGLPFSMTVIPRYVDPYGFLKNLRWDLTLDHASEMTKALKYVEANRGRIIMHGYTHQTEEHINCDSGISGDDFEFWNACINEPIKDDSEQNIASRIKKGLDIFARAGIDKIFAWVTPHYQGSPNANRVFGKTFPRVIGRVRYAPEPFDPADKINWAGQFFPYSIEKDVYGQHIWPENLGNIKVDLPPYGPGLNIRTAEDIIKSLKLNRVIRDAWGSFFWHPNPNFAYPQGVDSLDRVLNAALSMGYEFVDIKELYNRGE